MAPRNRIASEGRMSDDTYPSSGMIDDLFQAVDASWPDFVQSQLARFHIKHRREQMTSGSVRYRLLIEKEEFAIVNIRVIEPDRVYLSIQPGVSTRDQEQAVYQLGAILAAFVTWRNTEREYLSTKGQIEPIKTRDDLTNLTTATSTHRAYRPGRQPYDEDAWARAEIQRGTDREEVYQAWLKRLSTKRKLKDARDSFRHAVAEDKPE